MSFEDAFAHVIGVEGDYSNDPNDSGGATRFGITEKLARAYSYVGDMRDLPFDFARSVYLQEFWQRPGIDLVDAVEDRISLEMFDTAVNTGAQQAVQWLQRTLNVFNKGGALYPDISVDSTVGRATVDALTRFLSFRKAQGLDVLLTALNCWQGAFYLGLAENRVKDEDYVYGWILNRVTIQSA